MQRSVMGAAGCAWPLSRRAPAAVGALALITALLAGCGGAPASQTASKPPAAPASQTGSKPAAAPAASSGAPASAGRAKALTPVKFQLDYILGDYEVPTVLAKADGFYKANGLDVSIAEGKGSASTIQLVAQGHAQFGLADGATTALFISKGVPVTTVATFIQQTPDAFIAHTSAQRILKRRDLLGRSIIQTPGGSTFVLLPAVVHGSSVQMKQLKIVTVSPSDKYTAFLTTPRSVYTGYYPDDLIKLRRKDPQAAYTSFARFGVNPLSVNLVTSLQMIRDHPGTVRAFVHAAVQGYQAAQKDPASAIRAGRAMFPNALISLAGLKLVLGMLHSPATRGKPIGWMARSDWQQTVNLMHRYGGMKIVKPLSDDYTNQFIPQGSS